jgi:putative aldouronate transport system substrate-binding protein
LAWKKEDFEMKHLALLMVLLIILSSTDGCTEEAGQQTPVAGGSEAVVLSPDNPTTITVWITTSETVPASNNKLTKLLKDELGVTLDMEVTIPDNLDMRVGTLLASGEYPDLLGTGDLQYRLLKGGAFIRLNEYLDSGKYPLLKTHVDPYMVKLTYTGGEISDGFYIFPNFNRFYGEIPGGTHYGTGLWIQKAVLEDAGYPDLSNMTMERYFELIENYKTKYPEIDGQPTIGFEVLCSTGREWGLTNVPVFLAGHPNNGGVVVDENNVATIYADKQISYDWFKFLNQMHAKGLVDPEAFTQTHDQYLGKLANGNVLGMHDQRWNFGQAYDSLIDRGEPSRTWVATMPTYEGAEPYYADREVMNLHQGYGVSVSCKQVDTVLTFLETMMSDKWQTIISWGIEGEDYFVDENGSFYRNQEQRDNDQDLTWRASNRLMAFRDMLPKHQGTLDNGNYFSPNDSLEDFQAGITQYDRDFLAAYGKDTWRQFVNKPPENAPYYPCWSIALSNEAQTANLQMNDAALLYLPRAIMAAPAEFDSIWDDYLAALDVIDIEVYEQEINAGIQERLGN